MGLLPTELPNGHYSLAAETEIASIILFPCLIVSLVTNVVGLLLFAIFKKNRAFPVNMLIWIAVVNILYSGLFVARAAPTSGSLTVFYTHVTDGMCFFLVFFDMWFYFSLVYFNTAAALMLYLSVVRRADVENKKYLLGMIVGYFVYSFPAPLIIASQRGRAASLGGGYSTCFENVGPYVSIPLSIFMLAQIIMISVTIFQVARIITSAKSSVAKSQKRHDLRLILLTLRFTLTMISQLLEVSAYLMLTITETNIPGSVFIYGVIMTTLTPAMDAAILIFLNKPLLTWLRRRQRMLVSMAYSGSSSDSAKTQTTGSELQNQGSSAIA